MSCYCPPEPRHIPIWIRVFAWSFMASMIVLALSGCAGNPRPPQVVKVPVPVACEIEQVPSLEKPAASSNMGIFDLAKVALARLKIIEAENTRLRAANTTPCPGVGE